MIEPYLDGAYCNKIAQLDYLVDHAGGAGAFHMDLDVAVLTPLELTHRDAIRGKVVDGSNPPLATVERIFSAAGVPRPPIVPCDWEGRGETVATNLNGGFLYIPGSLLAPLREAWRGWAEWLHGSPELFGSAAERKHTDQLSFALALAADGLDWKPLSSNWNFPGGHDRRPQLYERDEPVHVLHYRSWSLDDAGLIRQAYRESGELDAEVARVNRLVAGRAVVFFERFRGGRARDAVAEIPVLEPDPFSPAFVAHTRRAGERRRLILHAGAPKTGTSSLQWHLASHRESLAAEGCWFPLPSLSPEPKHQPLNAALRRGDIAGFVRYVESALDGMPDHTHTVLLTTEGVFNHWSDYSAESKGALRRLAALFDFELCVWFREPQAFAAALYAQYLANPRSDGADAAVQGHGVSFGEALADDWFRGHLDFLGFYLEATMLFGAGRVRALAFEGDTVARFLDEYAIDGVSRVARRRNQSLHRVGVAGLRLVNGLALGAAARSRAAAIVGRIDRALGPLSPPFRPRREDRDEVNRCSERGWKALQPVLSAPRPRRRVLKGQKVFCVGFHKTGTKSLGAALTALGYRVIGPSGARDPAHRPPRPRPGAGARDRIRRLQRQPLGGALPRTRCRLSGQPLHPHPARHRSLDAQRVAALRRRGDADAHVDLRRGLAGR